MELPWLLVGAALGVLATQLYRLRDTIRPEDSSSSTAPQPMPEAATATTEQPGEPDAGGPRKRMQQLLAALAQPYDEAERGADLAEVADFQSLVELLAQAPFSARERGEWVASQNAILSCATLAAMTRAGDSGFEQVARSAGRLGYMSLHFAFEHLASCRDPQIAGLLLLRANQWWTDHAATRSAFSAWLDRLAQWSLQPQLGPDADSDWELDERRDILQRMGHPVTDAFLDWLAGQDRLRRGRGELAKIGQRLPTEPPLPVAVIEATEARCEALVELLKRDSRPSAVLLGPAGSGKTSLAHATLRQLQAQGWEVLEVSPAQIVAGQKYIGEIEARVHNFAVGLSAARTLCFIPDCHQLLETGAWSGNPRGLLDLLQPYIERGEIQLLGESTLAAWARVLSARPQVERSWQMVRIEPLADAEALALAQDWGRRWQDKLGCQVLSAAMASEARELARQQYPEHAEPGRTLSLLHEALAEALRGESPALPLDREQLLAALARRSGLPLEILDGSRPLDVEAIRSRFRSAVIGQDEAVDGLVDRISMLKAGLTDPKRPIGVFLFAGPTGTGKTELVKTLAQFLFGSPERMLRVDMSEYQSDDSYWRLLEDGRDGRAQSLATRIRQQPFSVVLLDEFEKAHPRVWDLFLQVFDDGRLTDRSGNTADFRHAIIVLTSNLGSTIQSREDLGFVGGGRGRFDKAEVERSIQRAFRPEFINRLDRVVIFNPLTRGLMRDILAKELRAVLQRRGFRSRDWAVEWEPSALEFLLDRGFTPDLGARPLRRAIDQYLLAPLARTMVEHRVPEGEQFLFIHGDGDRLRVQFVDPEAGTAAAGTATSGLDLRALALDPRAGAAELSLLGEQLDGLQARLAEPAWEVMRSDAVQQMQAADFWQRSERQTVLDQLERSDRIAQDLRAAQSLLGRLQRGAGRSASELVRRLALQALRLDAAINALLQGEPEDARLEVRAGDPALAASLAWRDRLAQMYESWARQRGLQVHREGMAEGAVLLRISGHAAWQGLRGEEGMHQLDGGEGQTRCTARVSVTSDPPLPGSESAGGEARLCRRYAQAPSPLVRDAVRGWRTGRLDRVLAGDFDLIAGD